MFVFSLFALFNTQIVVVVVVVIGLRVCVYVCRAISVSIELDTDSSVFIRFFFVGLSLYFFSGLGNKLQLFA